MSVGGSDVDSMPASATTRLIVGSAAIGEMAVGALAALFPGTVMTFLLYDTVQGTGLVVARMVGVAIVALGWTWWQARNEPRARLMRLAGGGLLLYNFGVAAIFAGYLYSRGLLLWVPMLVAAAHLSVGAGFLFSVGRHDR
jgi:hypothetical protein